MLKLESIFAVQETREVETPWVPGLFFTIARIGNSAYQAHVKAWQKKNPILRTVLGASVKAAVLTAGKRRDVDPDDKNAIAEMEAVQQEAYEKALEAAAEKIDAESIDMDSLSDDEGITLLLVGWRGMLDSDGANVAYTKDACMQLLQSTVPLPVGAPYGPPKPGVTVTLGQAVKAFVLKESTDMEVLRDSTLAVAAGESVASPDGASDVGRS